MTIAPVARKIDSHGRIDVPQNFWDIIKAKTYDTVNIIDATDHLELRKVLAAPAPTPPPTPTCKSNAHYDTALAKCVCNAGYKDDGAGNCIAIPAPPAAAFQDSFDVPYVLADGQVSPDGKWKSIYNGYGKNESAGGVFHMFCKTATDNTGNETHACLVESTQIFKNFILDVDMITNKQLRTGYPPKNWETAWIFFRSSDAVHSYDFLLKNQGWQFSKKDNYPGEVNPEHEIFPGGGSSPSVKLGTWQHITIKAIDFHFTIWVDNVLVMDMTDNDVHDPAKMIQGKMGMYLEDSDVSFDNWKVVVV